MLRSLSLLLRILGWLVLVLGVIFAIAALFAPTFLAKSGLLLTHGSSWLAFLIVLLTTVTLTIILLASSEWIQVILSLEEQVRKIRHLWDKK
jgi:uncharacterized membrane protein